MTDDNEKVAVVLASGSPRRKEILEDLKLQFSVEVSDVDESPLPTEKPQDLAKRLAILKGSKIAASNPAHLVIGADTIVAVDGETMGKPAGKEDAKIMLKKLSGKTHKVFTGISFTLLDEHLLESAVCKTDVTFKSLSDKTINEYLTTGEYEGKAGAYAIQGKGKELIAYYEGSFSNVVGLPAAEILKFVRSFGPERLSWK